MLAGIKPTVGRISRYGVIPITADQDTAGPMAKSVADVAIMFGALESASPDPNDPATQRCTPPPGRDYTRFLNRDGLKGARIGIPRAFFYERATPPGETNGRGGLNDDQKKAMDEAIAVFRKQGAIIVDPADIPSVVDKDPKNNFLLWGQCSGVNEGRGKDENCSVDLKYGMKRDFNKWLASLGAAAPVKTLTDLRRVQQGARTRRTRSSTASRTSTSPTRWTSKKIARATKPTARRTSSWAARTASTRYEGRAPRRDLSFPARTAPRSRRSRAIRR